jgi:hypothetical protein
MEPSIESPMTEPPLPPPLTRNYTTMAPNQNAENTCTAHMITRLFIKNIFKLTGMLNKNCNSFLHTDEFNKIGPDFDVQEEDVSLEKLKEACIDDESVLKLVMYLYIYFLIIEEYTYILTDGLNPYIFKTVIEHVTTKINEHYFPKNIKQYETIIIPFLVKTGKIKVNISFEDARTKIITPKFIDKIQSEYIGCSLYPAGNLRGHAVVIAHFHDGMLIIKDSYGVSNTEISVDDFFTTGYNELIPGFFMYMSPTIGGKSRKSKKLNRKSYRKHKK